jgi:TonB family protein
VAIRDHNGDERPSRLGYFAAIVVSALGHAAIFIFVFFIAPRFLQAPQAAPPSYTVKIVDNVPAGDLGTHLPPINKHHEEKPKPAASKPEEPKVKAEPPKNAIALNDTSDKNALRVNAPTVAVTETPTPTPEPTVEPKSLEPPIEATEQPTVEATPQPTPSPEPTKRPKKRPSPKPTPEKANRPKAGSTVARVASTPTVAQRMAKLRHDLMEKHMQELAKKEPDEEEDDNPDEPGMDENPANREGGGGPVVANVPPSEGKGFGVGSGEGSLGILKDPEFLLYYKTVQDQIKKSWTFTSGSNDLTATVDFAIGPDGALHNLKIGTSSNDSAFDDSVLRAVRRAAPFPAPPEKFRDLFSSGVEAQFELGELKS